MSDDFEELLRQFEELRAHEIRTTVQHVEAQGRAQRLESVLRRLTDAAEKSDLHCYAESDEGALANPEIAIPCGECAACVLVAAVVEARQTIGEESP